MFLDQVWLFVCQRAIERSLPTAPAEAFINGMFQRMVRAEDEFTLIDLLGLLLSEDCREDIFDGYEKRFER